MEIKPTEKEFYIFPLLSVVRINNPLTKEARITFDYDWDDYYQIKIGWLWWNKTF